MSVQRSDSSSPIYASPQLKKGETPKKKGEEVIVTAEQMVQIAATDLKPIHQLQGEDFPKAETGTSEHLPKAAMKRFREKRFQKIVGEYAELRSQIGPMNLLKSKMTPRFEALMQAYSDPSNVLLVFEKPHLEIPAKIQDGQCVVNNWPKDLSKDKRPSHILGFQEIAKQLESQIKELKNIHKIAHECIGKASEQTATRSLTQIKARPIAHGKVKQVWLRDHTPDKVYYTPYKDKRANEEELRTEVAQMGEIKNKLLKSVLFDFLGSKEVHALNLDDKTSGYLTKFPSVAMLKEEIEAAGEHHSEIGDSDLQKLKAFCKSAEGLGAVQRALEHGSCLAIEAREIDAKESIEGHYTVETPRADGDLEELIRHPDWYKPKDLVDIMSQILKGMSDLQKAGCMHGDLKPENVLVTWKDGTWQAKVADFGKAKVVPADGKPIRHVGNTRFAPWENQLTLQGEVCATGIELIRILEQQILAKKEIQSLIKPVKPGKGKPADKREGFERFVIEGNPPFNAIEANNGRKQMVAGRLSQAVSMAKAMGRGIGSKRLEAMGVEKDRYIDALSANLKEIRFAEPKAIDALCDFIKLLTHVDPERRPTMAQASEMFEGFKASLFKS